MNPQWKLNLITGLAFCWLNCMVYGSSVDTESIPALVQPTGRGGGSSVDTESAPAQLTGGGGPHSSGNMLARILKSRLNKQPSEEEHPRISAGGPLTSFAINAEGNMLRTDPVEWMEPLDRKDTIISSLKKLNPFNAIMPPEKKKKKKKKEESEDEGNDGEKETTSRKQAKPNKRKVAAAKSNVMTDDEQPVDENEYVVDEQKLGKKKRKGRNKKKRNGKKPKHGNNGKKKKHTKRASSDQDENNL